MESEKAAILNTGCDDLMRKPFPGVELLAMMTKHLGVCYTWSDIGNNDRLEPVRSHLDRDSFANLSNELLLELEHSVLAIDLDRIQQIVAAIEVENQSLAQTINQYIDNFEYEQILTLLPNR